MPQDNLVVAKSSEIGAVIATVEKGAFLRGRRFQHQQDIEFLEMQFLAMMPNCQDVLDAHADWQAFKDRKIE